MSAVWVVRDADGYPLGVGMWRGSAIDDADFGGDDLVMEELSGGSDGPFNGFTVTRETLLTPEMASVIAAATAQSKAADAIRTHRCIEELPCSHDREHIAACARTEAAVTTLRAQEGECAHEWTDARNSIVLSGEVCLKCRAIRAGNETTEAP